MLIVEARDEDRGVVCGPAKLVILDGKGMAMGVEPGVATGVLSLLHAAGGGESSRSGTGIGAMEGVGVGVPFFELGISIIDDAVLMEAVEGRQCSSTW